MKPIGILGEGAWGTAIASVVAYNHYSVLLWCYHQSIHDEIALKHTNSRYAPHARLSEHIIPTQNLEALFKECETIFIALPVQYTRSILSQVSSIALHNARIVILNKGIEQEHLLFPTQIVSECLQGSFSQAVLMGPTFAHDIMNQSLSGIGLAALNTRDIEYITQVVQTPFLKITATSDLIGMQLAGAYKNVIGILIGLLQAQKLADNTQAYFMTVAYQEMVLLAQKLGAHKDTVYGLSGFGDIVLSMMGKQSRNVHVGRLLGTGKILKEILETTGYVPEGINSVVAFEQLRKNYNLSMPLLENITLLVSGHIRWQDFLKNMEKQESYLTSPRVYCKNDLV